MEAVNSPLRTRRLFLKRTLTSVAEAVGISKPSLSDIERGRQKPRLELVRKLAKELELSPEAIDDRLIGLVSTGEAAE